MRDKAANRTGTIDIYHGQPAFNREEANKIVELLKNECHMDESVANKCMIMMRQEGWSMKRFFDTHSVVLKTYKYPLKNGIPPAYYFESNQLPKFYSGNYLREREGSVDGYVAVKIPQQINTKVTFDGIYEIPWFVLPEDFKPNLMISWANYVKGKEYNSSQGGILIEEKKQPERKKVEKEKPIEFNLKDAVEKFRKNVKRENS